MRVAWFLLVATAFTAVGLVTARPAEAVPGQCGGAIVFGSGGC
ncbi:hypothetical protein LITTLEE_111 [Mycobacterium phage LittleE]|uniref:Uncharacterized protein n=1 Tax=Mycobacterium phage LittleE TaxID=2922212 RepID=G1D3Z6_9CAUD|nr:hypothetical protein FGG27_gp111 [Mycobacterium phage LittleE]AEK09491.1 hypothetical protein LITTLEE_111 [Mycobacterium phage LittleE]ASD50735.1 hypothetical protein PORCELAIN_107 [Mycobacterium phage Porcelain]